MAEYHQSTNSYYYSMSPLDALVTALREEGVMGIQTGSISYKMQSYYYLDLSGVSFVEVEGFTYDWELLTGELSGLSYGRLYYSLQLWGNII